MILIWCLSGGLVEPRASARGSWCCAESKGSHNAMRESHSARVRAEVERGLRALALCGIRCIKVILSQHVGLGEVRGASCRRFSVG